MLEREPERARALHLRLRSFLDGSAPMSERYGPSRRKLREKSAEELRALGYL